MVLKKNKWLKKILNKDGFTLVELMVSAFIISMFFLVVASSIGSTSALYMIRLQESNASAVLETVVDDIGNQITYGDEPKLITIHEKGTQVGDIDMPTSMPEGTVIYRDGTWEFEKEGVISDSGDLNKLHLGFNSDNFKATGIDLGYQKIYVANIEKDGVKREYIYGTSYTVGYYSKMDLTLEIDDKTTGTEPVYNIVLSGKVPDGATGGTVKRTVRTLSVI